MAGMNFVPPLISSVILGLALAGPAAAAAEPPIQPGCWESVNEVTAPFHTTSKTQRMITPADVDRFLTGPINHHYTCVYPTHRVADGKLAMKGVCTDNKGRQVTIDSHGTYGPTSFRVEAAMGTRLLGLPISGVATTEAHRIGDVCPTPAAASK